MTLPQPPARFHPEKNKEIVRASGASPRRDHLQRHRHVTISVNIAEHRFHCRNPPREKHVLRVGASLSGTKPNPAASRHRDSADL